MLEVAWESDSASFYSAAEAMSCTSCEPKGCGFPCVHRLLERPWGEEQKAELDALDLRKAISSSRCQHGMAIAQKRLAICCGYHVNFSVRERVTEASRSELSKAFNILEDCPAFAACCAPSCPTLLSDSRKSYLADGVLEQTGRADSCNALVRCCGRSSCKHSADPTLRAQSKAARLNLSLPGVCIMLDELCG